VRYVEGSVLDEMLVTSLVADAEVIFPMGGRSGTVDTPAGAVESLESNCRGQLILLGAIVATGLGARVVYPGSRLEYGRALHLPVDESHQTVPTSLYGVHKLTCTHYHLVFHGLHGVRTTVLRISNPYGPCACSTGPRYSILNHFVDLAMQGKTIKVFGDGSQLRDYVFVDDVIEALLAAAATDASVGRVVNVGSGVGTRLLDAARMVVDIVSDGAVETVPWPTEHAAVETGDFVFSVDTAARILHWTPATALDEGLRATVAEVVAGGVGGLQRT